MFEPPIDVVDRICQRWAVSVSGGGIEPWADTVESKPPPLPDDLAVEVDRAILQAPGYYPELLRGWYRTPNPAEVIAKDCGLKSRQSVYTKLREALFYLLGRFEGKRGVIERFNARSRG